MLLKAFHVLTNYTKLGLDTKFDLKTEHLHLCIIVQGLIYSSTSYWLHVEILPPVLSQVNIWMSNWSI